MVAQGVAKLLLPICFWSAKKINGRGARLAHTHFGLAIALKIQGIFGGRNMNVEKVSYSSSLGVQVVAINFAVKYRHAIFRDARVKMRAIQSFEETARAHGVRTGLKILEIGVNCDHVHMVVQWGPGISLSEIMRLLKGRSARDVLRDFPELKKRKFWGGHMWSPAYHFLTTGTADLKHHLDYVKNQGKPRRPMPGPGQRKLDDFVA